MTLSEVVNQHPQISGHTLLYFVLKDTDDSTFLDTTNSLRCKGCFISNFILFFILFIIYTFFVWFSFFCVRNGFKGDQKMIKQVFVKSILKVDTIKVGNIHV